MKLTGRLDIYTAADYIDSTNVLDEVNKALKKHLKNIQDEEYLYWYRRGVTPVMQRQKEVRPEICNVINENHAEEIVQFKDGFVLTQPAFYVARSDESSERVRLLNEYLYRSGKHNADNRVVDWFHTVGKGVLFIQPNDDAEFPASVYDLDPRSAFTVYSLRPGKEPMLGINMVVDGDTVLIDAISKDYVWKLVGGSTTEDGASKFTQASAILSESKNQLAGIPIIEYRYNNTNMGAFEPVLDLLDAVDTVMSNRIDGIEQFIQSLAVATNCQFEEGTTANSIRQAGMILLKSIGENKADFKILSEQLNQSETQVLVDYLYKQILIICGMPIVTANGSSTSDNGVAVLARNGWYQAETCARNTEDLFKESNRYFDRIFTDILRRKGILDIGMSEFELQFAHGETTNIQSKAQACATLLGAGFAPVLAFQKSGVSNDPVNDVALSEKYLKLVWGDPDTKEEEKEEEVTIDETSTSNA